MKSSNISVLLLVVVICQCFTLPVSAKTIWNYQTPKNYVVYHSSSALLIDGLASEKIWQDVAWSDHFVDIEGNKKAKPYFDTRVKMLWDEDYLYFYAELEEEHIWADITERDEVIFYNNDFEIFIKTSPFDSQYAEFEVNALGTIWDLLLFNTYRHDVPVINQWDMKGAKVAVKTMGTLNNPNDIDKAWAIEIALPLKDLAETGKRNNMPIEGTQWRLNFSRVQWQHDIIDGQYQRKKNAKGKYLPEYNWVWSPQGVIAMHQPETWGTLHFSKQKIGTKVYQGDQEELVKQSLFYLYRLQLKYFKQHNNYPGEITQLVTLPLVVNGIELMPQLTKTLMGYEISIVNPTTGVTLVINHYGQLMKL